MLTRRLKQNHLTLPAPPSPISQKRKYRAPSEATSPTDSTSAADFHPPTTKRTRFASEESPESNTSRYDFRRRARQQEPDPRPSPRTTGMPKSRYPRRLPEYTNGSEDGTKKLVENNKQQPQRARRRRRAAADRRPVQQANRIKVFHCVFHRPPSIKIGLLTVAI